MLEEWDEQHPATKASNMGKPGDPSPINGKGQEAVEDLNDDPKADDDEGGNLDDAHKPAEGDQSQNAGVGV